MITRHEHTISGLHAVADDLLEQGYVEVAAPAWLEWAAVQSNFKGAVRKVVAIVGLDVATASATDTTILCQRFEAWSRPLRNGGMATLIVLSEVPLRETLERVLEGERAWYCAHVTRVVYDANARIYWFWQPANGIQRSQRLPA